VKLLLCLTLQSSFLKYDVYGYTRVTWCIEFRLHFELYRNVNSRCTSTRAAFFFKITIARSKSGSILYVSAQEDACCTRYEFWCIHLCYVCLFHSVSMACVWSISFCIGTLKGKRIYRNNMKRDASR